MTVELVRASASDADVLFAARVSTQGEQTLEAAQAGTEASARDRGLINYLMRDRHGSPFEHNSMTFYVQAPIFVFREFMRHRIASYSVQSQRYVREGAFEFVVPPEIEADPAAKEIYLAAMRRDQEDYDRLAAILKDNHTKRLVAGGGARVDGAAVTDDSHRIPLSGNEIRISSGKKKHGILRRA